MGSTLFIVWRECVEAMLAAAGLLGITLVAALAFAVALMVSGAVDHLIGAGLLPALRPARPNA